MNSTFKVSRFNHLKLCFFLSIVLFISLISCSYSPLEYKVIHIVDGDTIDIDYKGTQERVRLLCVDTPESVHPDKKRNIPMGEIASDYTKKRLSGKSVGIELESKTRGKYGRLLAYVLVDGQNFNIELVQQGLSPYYTKYGQSEKYDKDFREAEISARDKKLNIWGDPELKRKYLRMKSKWGQR